MSKSLGAASKVKRKRSQAEAAVELLRPFNASNFKALLKDADWKVSGTKPQLIDRVFEAIADGAITFDEVVERLDAIQGWGDQQIYLYDVPEPLSTQWADEAFVRQTVDERDLLNVFDARDPVLLPDERTLTEIDATPERIRFVWVERRRYLEPEAVREQPDGRVIKEYVPRVARGVLALDWDLVRSRAMVMIQTLPSGTNYRDVLHSFMTDMKTTVGLDTATFTQINIAKAISAVANSREVLDRVIKPRTRRGSSATFTSSSRKSDVRDDADLKDVVRQTSAMPMSRASLYWHANERLAKRLHTTMIAADGDNRVGIHGERTQQEVEHVLARIWDHIKS